MQMISTLELRPYQQECVTNVLKRFEEDPVASVNMFCGLGKTRVIVQVLNSHSGH